MNEAELVAKWNAERELYLAWGVFVASQISVALEAENSPIDLKTFLKIPPIPRTKDTDSLLGKAFHRNKSYLDPYAEIEDKVGVRFVVLLTSDIKRLAAAIDRSTLWTASLDKDYEAERNRRPLEFTYQSMHYVLKATSDTVVDGGVVVPAGTPCEVQLRTLLQHAHSELTHDSIYKRDPGVTVNKKVERTVAKSMALIEAVDEYFMSAIEELAAANQIERDALETLADVFYKCIGIRPNSDKTNALILQIFRDKLGVDLRQNVVQMLQEKPVIATMIRERFDSNYIYRQPWILLAYWLAQTEPAQTAGNWPLVADELRPVYRDLGIRFPTVD